MLPDINVYKILEIIGTIAFASSGAMVAVKRRLDYLGIVVLGVTTAVGGGMCRDILIGQTPPGMFLDPTNTIIAFWTVNCMFLTIRMKWSQLLHLQGETYDNIMNFLGQQWDLGFSLPPESTWPSAPVLETTASSAPFWVSSPAWEEGSSVTSFPDRPLWSLGSISTPGASIAGAVSYLLFMQATDHNLSMFLSSSIVVMIRLLARKYDWNLPGAQ